MREAILKFVERLRAAGVEASVAESLDAMRAVAAAGFERPSLSEALAATLIKDEADRPVFDELFVGFFGPSPGPGREPGARAGSRRSIAGASARGEGEGGGAPRTAEPEREPSGRPAGSQRGEPATARSGTKESAVTAHERNEPAPAENGQDARRPSEGGRKPPPGAGEAAADQTGGRSPIGLARAAERKPFSEYSDLDYHNAREALAPLSRRFRVRLGRRLRASGRGRLDFRRTIRAAAQRGGTLIDLRFRARRPRYADLLVLADISGSVRYSSALMLELIAGARRHFRRVRSFVFIDHLAEADFEGGHLVMSPAVDLYARSDFGRVLTELWARRAEVIGRATLVVIMGDGRNNRRPPRADLLREIARQARAVVWLNPEQRERWGTGDSAIRLYQREVTALVPCANLRELERALARVA